MLQNITLKRDSHVHDIEFRSMHRAGTLSSYSISSAEGYATTKHWHRNFACKPYNVCIFLETSTAMFSQKKNSLSMGLKSAKEAKAITSPGYYLV
jgi:hypothetical protein